MPNVHAPASGSVWKNEARNQRQGLVLSQRKWWLNQHISRDKKKDPQSTWKKNKSIEKVPGICHYIMLWEGHFEILWPQKQINGGLLHKRGVRAFHQEISTLMGIECSIKTQLRLMPLKWPSNILNQKMSTPSLKINECPTVLTPLHMIFFLMIPKAKILVIKNHISPNSQKRDRYWQVSSEKCFEKWSIKQSFNFPGKIKRKVHFLTEWQKAIRFQRSFRL